MWRGDIRAGDTLDFKFNTADGSGAPITLAGSPSLACYKDNGTTESTSGLTLTVDFDSKTGLHNVRVDTSSDGTFYAGGHNFQVVIAAGTVDGVSMVGRVLGEFSIEARSALMPTTAGRKLDVSSGGEAGVDWANVGSPTTTLNLSGTSVKTATDVETDTQDIQSRLPAALVSGRMDSSTGAMAANVLTSTAINDGAFTAAKFASDFLTAAKVAADVGTEIATAVWAATNRLLTAGTNIVLAKGTGVTGFNDLDASGVRSAVGLASANLDTQLDAVPTANENADALLNRDMSAGTDSGSASVRTPRQALRFLRNRFAIAAGMLSVYKENDTTVDWTSTVQTDSSASPIISSNPAGP